MRKLKYKNIFNGLLSMKLEYEYKNYYDISLDVIKRGPLLLLLIGLTSACLSFTFELILFFSKKSWIHNLN